MKIKVKIKDTFGKRKFYPADDKAGYFCAIAKTKTLTEVHIKLIKALGFSIEVVPEVDEL